MPNLKELWAKHELHVYIAAAAYVAGLLTTALL